MKCPKSAAMLYTKQSDILNDTTLECLTWELKVFFGISNMDAHSAAATRMQEHSGTFILPSLKVPQNKTIKQKLFHKVCSSLYE